MTGSQEIGRSARGALQPVAWPRASELIVGFGGRTTSVDASKVVRARQVHGVGVARADGLEVGRINDVEADALVVTRPGMLVAVATADCVPILLFDPTTMWCAAVHAGWRGTLSGVVDRTIDAAVGAGIAPKELFAAIGPAIGGCCYEVGEDVAVRFRDTGLSVLEPAGRAKPSLDLRDINRRRLESSGLLAERIQVCGPCTRCRADLYHSYRADRDAAGRQLSWIGSASRSP